MSIPGFPLSPKNSWVKLEVVFDSREAKLIIQTKNLPFIVMNLIFLYLQVRWLQENKFLIYPPTNYEN